MKSFVVCFAYNCEEGYIRCGVIIDVLYSHGCHDVSEMFTTSELLQKSFFFLKIAKINLTKV